MLDCGKFPDVENGIKRVRRTVSVNSTHEIDVSVEYICPRGWIYSLPNPNVTCTGDGFDNEVGKCVKG